MKTEETIKSLIHRFEQCSQDGTGYFDAELSPEECEVVVLALCGLAALNQYRSERDIAVQQLNDLGYEFGEKPRKDDQISRQTAIRAITSHDGVVDKSVAKRILVQLPSAQPEIIYCKDCEHHYWIYCMDAFPREICDLDQTFYDSNFDYCSLAKRRTDERFD